MRQSPAKYSEVSTLRSSQNYTLIKRFTFSNFSFAGKLIEAEDNMNCNMSSVHVTYRDGSTTNLENVYIRGSKIRFFILPDMLKNAPMFKKTGPKTAGASRGKSGILRAQGECYRNPYFVHRSSFPQ